MQGTNDSSIVSKRSMARLGYFHDPYLQPFVAKPSRRSPLINRGYYIRFVESSLKRTNKHNCSHSTHYGAGQGHRDRANAAQVPRALSWRPDHLARGRVRHVLLSPGREAGPVWWVLRSRLYRGHTPQGRHHSWQRVALEQDRSVLRGYCPG